LAEAVGRTLKIQPGHLMHIFTYLGGKKE